MSRSVGVHGGLAPIHESRYDRSMRFLELYSQFAIKIFGKKMLPLHGGAVLVTASLVYSGFDWAYLVFVLQEAPFGVLLAANLIGFIIPIFLPLALWVIAWFRRTPLWQNLAAATSYAVVLGFTLSTIAKAFTGRTSPPHFHPGEVVRPLIDNSTAFNFGFMNEHVLGGWPSSHTTIAFALATTLALLLPPRWYIRVCLFALAFFIGLGVTFGFHWFSEFVAGVCLGIAIGLSVGRYYRV